MLYLVFDRELEKFQCCLDPWVKSSRASERKCFLVVETKAQCEIKFESKLLLKTRQLCAIFYDIEMWGNY